MIDYKNSIVLVGGVGAGKSLVGRAISRKTGMEQLTLDEFRHLPLMPEIDRVLNDPNLPPRRRDEYTRFKYLRARYPNIRNYEQFGFSVSSSQYLEHHFGKIAWHYYNKAFENMLLQDVCANVSGAVIIDTGGGMPICLDEEYAKLRDKFESLNKGLFYREFAHLDMVSKEVTHAPYKEFSNVLYLKTPENRVDKSARANDDILTRYFESSGDYNRVSTMTIDTTGLYTDGKPNMNHLDNITNQIIDSVTTHTLIGE